MADVDQWTKCFFTALAIENSLWCDRSRELFRSENNLRSCTNIYTNMAGSNIGRETCNGVVRDEYLVPVVLILF